MNGAITREQEKAAIKSLRLLADRMTGDEWVFDSQGRDFHLWTKRFTGEQDHICTIHAAALDDERRLICCALPHIVLFLGLLDRAAAKVRALEAELGRWQAETRKGDYTTQAAMLLSDRAFQRFLDGKGCGAPVTDAASADTRLKFVLNIESKKQFNTDERAKAAWRRLASEFEAWKRGGR